MLKRIFSPLTLVNQLALIVLLSAIIGVTGMAISGWLVQGVQGSAHAINKAGSLRMQSYRLLAAVPLQPHEQRLLTEMQQTANSYQLQSAARNDGQQAQLHALQEYWQQQLMPKLRQAKKISAMQSDVAAFVNRLDQLVSDFDHTTEQRIAQVILLQRLMIVCMGLLFIFTILWLRAKLLRPWRQLIQMAHAVSHRDFSQRVPISGRNEMAMLGMALNNMSAELAHSYTLLEQRVQEKTADLEQKNQILSFLWQANRRLHTPASLCERLSPILCELQQLTPLRNIQLRVYDGEDEENHQEFTSQPDAACQQKACQLCPPPLSASPGVTLSWRLSDGHTQYGLLLATLADNLCLSHDQQQLIDTLIEQITATLAIRRHQEHQQQLVVMQERTTIARELHDSIAQSLSCIKMQVSCLQMRKEPLSDASQRLLQQIRHELNASWLQLRELLTTFRLKLAAGGLRPALEASCDEFSQRLGFRVRLDYQLAPWRVPSHQAIHLLQITREALSNALNHAAATEICVQVSQQRDQVTLSIRDNGCGLPDDAERRNHYGLIIMRDRAQSLHGDCQIQRCPAGGTEVIVTFTPEDPSLNNPLLNNSLLNNPLLNDPLPNDCGFVQQQSAHFLSANISPHLPNSSAASSAAHPAHHRGGLPYV